MRRRAWLALLGTAALVACGRLIPSNNQTIEPARLEGGTYRLDPSHFAVLWKVSHLGFSHFVGRFDRADATLDFDPAAPAAASLTVTVETASLDTRLPDLDSTLRGSGWFDVATYPQAVFRSTAIAITGPATGSVTGDLTLLGVTRPVTLDVTFNGGATNLLTGHYTLGFAATGTLLRSEFGLTNLVPAVGDEVELEIQAEFQKH